MRVPKVADKAYGMTTIRICDIDNGALAVQLRDVLDLLGPRALRSAWAIAPVASERPEFDASGPGAETLQALSSARATVSGLELAALAGDTTQIIWGLFSGVDVADAWITIRFVDSTFCEITSGDPAALDAIRTRYKDVRT